MWLAGMHTDRSRSEQCFLFSCFLLNFDFLDSNIKCRFWNGGPSRLQMFPCVQSNRSIFLRKRFLFTSCAQAAILTNFDFSFTGERRNVLLPTHLFFFLCNVVVSFNFSLASFKASESFFFACAYLMQLSIYLQLGNQLFSVINIKVLMTNINSSVHKLN